MRACVHAHVCVCAKPVNNNTFQLHCGPFSFSLEKQRGAERKKTMKCEGNGLEMMGIKACRSESP